MSLDHVAGLMAKAVLGEMGAIQDEQVRFRVGTVTAVDTATSTCSVTLNGSSDALTKVPYLAHVNPAVDDILYMMQIGLVFVGIGVSGGGGIYGRWRWAGANITVPTGTPKAITFDTEDEDSGLGLTPTWGASGWTVPKTANYDLYLSVQWTASGTRGLRIRAARTGSGLHDLIEFDYDPVPPATGWGGTNQQAVSSSLRLTAGWVVWFEAYQATGGTRYIDEAFVSIQES